MSIEASSRGYLPHINGAEFQFITYRLADSLPAQILDSIQRYDTSTKKKQATEKYLDAGYGQCLLAVPENAQLIVDSWHFYHQKDYRLIAYVVMPNHVHLLIQPYPNRQLGKLIQRWKSYTAHQINTKDGCMGRTVWMPDYWDRYIRDADHFWRSVDYIHQNPVKAGLISCAEDWCFSSAVGFDWTG